MNMKRFLNPISRGLPALIVIGLLAMFCFPLVVPIAGAVTAPVFTRTLPGENLAPGDTFDVTVAVTANADEFGVGVGDLTPSTPSDWLVTANPSWCSPATNPNGGGSWMYGGATPGKYDMTWVGVTWDSGTNFSFLYRVTVPSNTPAGTYSFGCGMGGCTYGGGGVMTVAIGGNSQVEVRADDVWVDDDWENQGDVDAYDASLVWLYNAFNTTQDGIDNVAGSTVHVLPGTYNESPVINSSLTLLGAQANVEPVGGGRTGGESTINGTINIYADDVVVNGFEIPNQHDAIVGRNNRALHQNVQMLYNYIHSNVGGAVGINLICDNPAVATTTFKDYVVSHNYISLSVSDRAAIGLNANTPDTTKNYVYDGLELSYNEITAPSAHGICIFGLKDIYSLNDPVVEHNYIHDCWRGLYLINMTNADINNNEIEYCGTEAACIVVFGGTFADNILRSGDPIYTNSYCLSLFGTQFGSAGSHNVSFTGNDIYYNGCSAKPANGARVYSDGNDLSTIAFTHNNFYDGSANATAVAVRNYNAGTDLDTELNWWGDASGPYNAPLNPGGLGGGVTDDVDFEPWLMSQWSSTDTSETSTEDLDEGDTVTAGAASATAKSGSGVVTVAEYLENPSGSSFYGDTGTYIDVYVPSPTDIDELLIKLYYDEGDLDPDVDEDTLAMYWWDGDDWSRCSSTGVETAADYIWARITGGSFPSIDDLSGTFFGGGALEPEEEEEEAAAAGLLVLPESASFVASYMKVSPQQVLPGQEVEISINIANHGGESGSHNVALFINGYVEQSQTVSVSPGSARLVVFRISKTVPGTYQVSMEGAQGQFTVLDISESTAQPATSGGLGTAGIVTIVIIVLALIVAIVFIFRSTSRP